MRKRSAAAASLLFISPLAIADSGSSRSDASELNPVIVTATRTAQTVDDSLAAVTVITREDIDRLQPQSLADLFAGLPGISVSNNGGPGKITSVFLRGASDTELLVLIDGIKVGSATSGTTPFEQFPVDQIERIEIVRGPRSSLYGSDAVGGVIQIFTRKGSRDLTPSFSGTVGTYDTWQGQAGLSGGFGNAWYSASVGGYRSNGINATTPQNAGYEPDTDPYWNGSGSLRGGYRFDNGAEISADWLRVYGHNHFDALYFGTQYANQSGNVTQVLGATARLPQIGIWQPSLSVGQSEDQEHDFGGAFPSLFNTLRTTAGWQNDFAVTPHQEITAGVDYLKDHVFSDTQYTGTSRENYGGYLQYQGRFGRSDVQLSARDDQNQQFGSHWTGAGAVGYEFSPALRVRASYGTAFRAPTFNDLYYPPYAPGVPAANPDLRPEKSRSGEIGFSGRPAFAAGIWDWALDAYQTNVSDMIVLDENFLPSNKSSARLRGVEGQLGVNEHGWSARLYASYLDPRDRGQGDDNHILTRRASQTARLDLDRSIGRFSFGTSVNASGRTFNDADNTEKLGGYATFDLRGGWQVLDSWLLQARLSNLLDKHYETVQYYNQPGRAVYVTLLYHPVHS